MNSLKKVSSCVLLMMIMLLACCIAGCNEANKINFYVGDTLYATIETNGNEKIDLPTNPKVNDVLFEAWYFDADVWSNKLTSTKYTNVALSETVSVYAKFDEIFTVQDSTITGLTDTAWMREIPTIKIPSEFNGVPIDSIATQAFDSYTFIITVIVPDSVLKIGEEAFGNRSWYTNQTHTDEPSIIYAGKVAYSHAGIMEEGTTLTLRAGTKAIADSAFQGLRELTSIEIPSTVEYIGAYAFAGCSNVENIIVESGNSFYYESGNCLINTATNSLIFGTKDSIIPNSVMTIERAAYSMSTELTNLLIPTSVETICANAFSASGLTSIELTAVKNIGDNAFTNCSSLVAVIIADTLEILGNNVFAYCDELTTIYYRGSENEWNNIVSEPSNAALNDINIIFNYVE